MGIPPTRWLTVRQVSIGLVVVTILLGLIPQASAQVGTPRCQVDASLLSAAGTVQSRALPAFVEVELTLVNKTQGRLRMDPRRFALIPDRGDPVAPASPEQVIDALQNPAPVGLGIFGFFSIGSVGVAIGAWSLDLWTRTIDARILRAGDLAPGATVRGSVYFRPASWPAQFTLALDGLALESGTGLPRVELQRCQMPFRPSEPLAVLSPLPTAMRTISLSARADAGPLSVGISNIEFTRFATTLAIVVENAAEADADMFTAIGEARLVDNMGNSYAVRILPSDLPHRVVARSLSRGRLVFEPLPIPPAVSSAVLTIPGVRIADAAYDLKIDLRF